MCGITIKKMVQRNIQMPNSKEIRESKTRFKIPRRAEWPAWRMKIRWSLHKTPLGLEWRDATKACVIYRNGRVCLWLRSCGTSKRKDFFLINAIRFLEARWQEMTPFSLWLWESRKSVSRLILTYVVLYKWTLYNYEYEYKVYIYIYMYAYICSYIWTIYGFSTDGRYASTFVGMRIGSIGTFACKARGKSPNTHTDYSGPGCLWERPPGRGAHGEGGGGDVWDRCGRRHPPDVWPPGWCSI